MNLNTMIEFLNCDLRNEWKHLRFYLYHASVVVGLHHEEYKELFLKEAANEMQHVTEFSSLILGLGGTPTNESNDFPLLEKPEEIIKYALSMEREVVANYVRRIDNANELGNQDSVDARWIEIFLEGQIQKSREDIDKYEQIIKGF
jgi:bacterioferritin (cytochrome b1)